MRISHISVARNLDYSAAMAGLGHRFVWEVLVSVTVDASASVSGKEETISQIRKFPTKEDAEWYAQQYKKPYTLFLPGVGTPIVRGD